MEPKNDVEEVVSEPITKAKLEGGRFRLSRVGDRAGDSGSMLVSIDPKTTKPSKNGEIVVGSVVRCGSVIARSYTWQDYWTTTPVTEILEVSEDKKTVKFKTRNSVYVAESI